MTFPASQPRDLDLEWQSTLAFGGLMLMVSGLFVFSVPWWRPLLWASIYNVLLWWRRSYLLNAERGAVSRQRAAKRVTHWVCAGWAGSAGYWLYVPQEPMMHGVLVFGLLCVITSIVLESVGDALRIGVSLFLIMAPAAIRFLFEPAPVSIILGAGAFVAGPAWWQLWRRQQRVWREQFEMRQKAEHAAQALAETTLAKARFFAAANHDLRQPVHVIGLSLATLQRQSLDADGRDALLGVQRAWQALSTQLEQLLDLARSESGALQPQIEVLDLIAFVDQQIRYSASLAASKGQRLVALGSGQAFASADALMLTRVLSNLVGNALKFSPAGACIALAVRRGSNGDYRIQVRDNGPGIPMEEQTRVFDDFVQIGNAERDRSAGFGLGLAIARQFMEAMQGTISVRSHEGRGAVFEIRLPAADAPYGTATARAEAYFTDDSPALDALPHIPRLLLAEDDEMVVAASRTLARQWGVPFVASSVGAELRQLAAPGDVALCDIRLPAGQSGIELACQLREQGVIVALISGEIGPDTLDRIAQLGLDLLIKPVSPEALRALLCRLGAQADGSER